MEPPKADFCGEYGPSRERALDSGEFLLIFGNKLLHRVNPEPHKSAQAEYECHQDQWQVITAEDFGDIAERDTRKKGTHLSRCVHGATHRPRRFPRNIKTNRELHRPTEADSAETQGEQQKGGNFRGSKGGKQGAEASTTKTDYSNPAARRPKPEAFQQEVARYTTPYIRARTKDKWQRGKSRSLSLKLRARTR